MTGRGVKIVMLSVLASAVAIVAPGLARAASITEFTSGVTSPRTMVTGSDGNVWFINGAGIAKIDSSGHVTTYTVGLDSGATPYDLTNGPLGVLWFTDNGAKGVGYITPSGAIHEFRRRPVTFRSRSSPARTATSGSTARVRPPRSSR